VISKLTWCTLLCLLFSATKICEDWVTSFEKKATEAKIGVPLIVKIIRQKNRRKRSASKIFFAHFFHECLNTCVFRSILAFCLQSDKSHRQSPHILECIYTATYMIQCIRLVTGLALIIYGQVRSNHFLSVSNQT